MSAHESEIFEDWAVSAEDATFELALRGYSRRQVNRYLRLQEARLVDLRAERDAVADELDTARAEIAVLREQLTRTDADTVMTDRMRAMLMLARDEADAVRQVAYDERVAGQKAAEALMVSEWHRAAEARRDFELALQVRRARERETDAKLHEAARADAERLIAEAKAEARDLKGPEDVPKRPARRGASADRPARQPARIRTAA